MTPREEWVEAAFAAYCLGIGDEVQAEIEDLYHWPDKGETAACGINLPALIRDVLSMPDGGYAVRYATEPLIFELANLAVGAALLYANGAPLLRVLVGRSSPGMSNVRVEGGTLDHDTKTSLLFSIREFALMLPERTGFRGRRR